MQRLVILAFLAALAIGSVGCASVVSLISNGGLDQELTFTSEPPGARLFLNGSVPLGETPLKDVKVARSENAYIIAKKDGFEDQTIRITYHFNHWFWGNFILGGLLGSTTDFADGAVVKLDPTTYHLTLTPKQASREQMQQHVKTRWARHFLLVGYPDIQADLIKGDGEYLSSLLAILKVPAGQRDQVVERLRKLSGESTQAPDFAERVLHDFHWAQL